MFTIFNIRKTRQRLFYYGIVFFFGFGFFVVGDYLTVTTGTTMVYQPEKQASLVIHLQGEEKVDLKALPPEVPLVLVIGENTSIIGHKNHQLVTDEKWKRWQEEEMYSGMVRFLGMKELLSNDQAKINTRRIIVETDMPPVKPEDINEAITRLMKNGYNIVQMGE